MTPAETGIPVSAMVGIMGWAAPDGLDGSGPTMGTGEAATGTLESSVGIGAGDWLRVEGSMGRDWLFAGEPGMSEDLNAKRGCCCEGV